MAVNPSIALAVKPMELADPLAQYGKFAQIQAAQNQNALAQYQLSAAQREDASTNALNAAYAAAYDPTTGKIDANKLRQSIAQAGFGSKLPAIEKSLSEQQTAELTRQKTFNELVGKRMELSRQQLEGVSTPEQFIAWHQSNHADPVLAEYFKQRGITADQSMERIKSLIQTPEGFNQLLRESKLGTEKALETHFQQQNLGSTTQVLAIPKYGPGAATVVPGSQATVTASPDAVARAEATRYAADVAHRDRVAKLAKETETGDFSDDSVDLMAQTYLQTGTLPPLGYGASKIRQRIIDRAADISMGERGQTAEEAATGVKNAKTNIMGERSFLAKEGRGVRAHNVLLGHLDTLEQAALALNNGNIRAFNMIGNEINKQLGAPAPTSFDAVKKIVGDELVKAIQGGAGGVYDRKEIAETIDRANSPQQLLAAIDKYKKLGMDQLAGLEQQYKASSGKDDFRTRFLTPKTAEKFKASETPAMSPQDKQALDWANANPNDPRAKEIKAKLGVK